MKVITNLKFEKFIQKLREYLLVNRKKIERIEFDFVYNLVQRKITFENIKIDDVLSVKGNKFIDGFNSKNKFLNKILFKNIVNSFFSAHFG